MKHFSAFMCSPITCITGGRPFGQDGCQVPVRKGICGEKRTLEFINEFKKLFAQKMEEIDAQGGGDCMQVRYFLTIKDCYFFIIYLTCVGGVCTFTLLRNLISREIQM